MPPHPIRLADKFSQFQDRWSPKVVAELNDYQVKLAKLQGEFVWHAHPETDELFLVVSGHLKIAFRDGMVELQPGDLLVVPRGVEHRPIADEECQVLLIEPRGVINTGNAGGDLTADNEIWI